jgi:sulfatase modifying factor 1
MRAVPSLILAMTALSGGSCVVVDGCAHSEASAGAEGPSTSRLEAAPPALADAGEVDPWPEDASAPPEATAASSCLEGMVLVDGEYCTEVRQDCVEWMDRPENPLARCARFAPSVCTGSRVHKRFCIDRDEYVAAGEALPLGDASWTQARELCEGQRKRLCKETEWELACEGEPAFPYPTGYVRDAGACNFDKGALVDPATGRLRDQRQAASTLDGCVSPFGARSMTGNVDEWVWRDRTYGAWRSALKGGWWMAARERCRPATTSHDEHYRELQTGFRCCAEARAPSE